MYAARAYRAPGLAAASSLRYRPTYNLAHHLTRRTPTATNGFLPSPRNVSTSTPHRAQYTRFDDDPNRPRPPFAGLQRRDIIIYTIGAGSVIYYFAHLEKVPETGRWRFMDISSKYEAALWEASYAQLSEEFRGKLLPPSHAITQGVHRITSRILDANDLGTLRSDLRPSIPARKALRPTFGFDGEDGYGNGGGDETAPDLWDPDAAGRDTVHNGASRKEWNLLVVNDKKVVNAMATPGTIVVFTGILPVAKDAQGLAAILGHEIGHVVARHMAERYSYSKIFIALAWLAEVIGLPSGLGRIMTTLLMDLPHSRTQEYEADKIGLKLSAKACFDPTAAPAMFKRLGELEKSSGGLNVSFLNTHPASDDRVKELESMLPEAFTVKAAACGGTSDYLSGFEGATGLSRTTPWNP